MSQVQSNIAAGYLSAYERPIAVSVMSKLTQWPFQQQLGFAGALSYHNATFHGLSDFKTQMASYSSTHWILTAAYAVIKYLIPNNASVAALMYPDAALGQVGNQFQSLQNFGQVFALSPTDLQNPSAIGAKVSALAG
jgi:hypothetical protein